MDPSTGSVQQERERTRAAISEKIELIEERVRGSVEGAKTAVKQSFDLRHHVGKRPWQMLGVSVVVGYLIGRWAVDHSFNGTRSRDRTWAQTVGFEDPTAPAEGEFDDAAAAGSRGPLAGLFEPFRGEIEALKGAAIAAVASVARDLLKAVTSSLTQPRAARQPFGETDGRSI